MYMYTSKLNNMASTAQQPIKHKSLQKGYRKYLLRCLLHDGLLSKAILIYVLLYIYIEAMLSMHMNFDVELCVTDNMSKIHQIAHVCCTYLINFIAAKISFAWICD